MRFVPAHRVQLVRIPEPFRLAGALTWAPAHNWPYFLDAPDQLIVEATSSLFRAAVLELGYGAQPGARIILADGLGLGEGLVCRALPALI